MRNPTPLLLLAALMAALPTKAQTNSSLPTAQTAPVPCTPVGWSATASSTNSTLKLSDDAKKKIDQKRKWLQQYSPIQLPDPTAPAKTKQALPPCPPARPNTEVAPTLKLTPDFSLSLRCNPLVASPKGVPGASGGFSLPDPHNFGMPEANQPEADIVNPDANAKTPCYALKVDPKTNKYFIAQ